MVLGVLVTVLPDATAQGKDEADDTARCRSDRRPFSSGLRRCSGAIGGAARAGQYPAA